MEVVLAAAVAGILSIIGIIIQQRVRSENAEQHAAVESALKSLTVAVETTHDAVQEVRDDVKGAVARVDELEERVGVLESRG